MSDKKHVVKVSILGDEYTIRSDETPEHTRAVAEYVDQAIRRVLESSQVVETQRAVIMTALQVTSELFQARAARQELDRQMDALAAEIQRWLPPAKRSGEHAAIPG
jgi:cell division protein ZapA